MGLLDRLRSAFGVGSRAPDEATGEPPDDVERDPQLEAQDDSASFDFEQDIARFFTAEFRIEQVWTHGDRRERLFAEYEIRDGTHWYQVKATFERWLESPRGRALYPDESALMQARMTTTQTVTLD
jgi:hypothetical protein